MVAWRNAPEPNAPVPDAARFVEHFWSVSWDRRADGPFESAVITFPAIHITREWGNDVVRHGVSLPNTLVHGVVPKVFRTTISGRGAVVGARFHSGVSPPGSAGTPVS